MAPLSPYSSPRDDNANDAVDTTMKYHLSSLDVTAIDDVDDDPMTSRTEAIDERHGDDTEDSDGMSGMSTVTNTIYNVLLPIVCVFGIAGILLTLVVLTRKTMRTSTNCYLLALSAADLIFLVLLGSMLGIEYLAAIEDGRAHSAIIIYGEYAKIVTNIALMASVWITVMLAVERYVAICRPFLAPVLCTVRISIVVISVVYIAATACRMPNFWENSVTWGRDPEDPTNETYIAFMDWTQLAYDPGYVTVYPWVVDGVLTSVLPFVALVILNTSLVREVRRSTKYLQRHVMAAAASTHTQREELQISVMLIGIVVVFFICQTPYVVYSAVTSIRRGTMEPTPSLLLFQRVALLLLTLKSAVNFIIYCWFSEKFRATLRRVFHCVGGCSNDGGRGNEVNGCRGAHGCCCNLCCTWRCCPVGSTVAGERRRETYCSVKLQTTAIQLTAM